MKRLYLKNIGPISEADLKFGDLTVLIGPQASGKSIALQMLKLIKDAGYVKSTLKKNGFDHKNDTDTFLNLFFGEGMSSLNSEHAEIKDGNKKLSFQNLMNRHNRTGEKVFLIPAHRIMTIQNGWPRNFGNFEMMDPFVVKNFSEQLRTLMERIQGTGNLHGIFPQEGRMKKVFRDKINEHIYHNATLDLDAESPKKRILLSTGESKLPYMVWSAGQREFMPLLLGLYRLMPASRVKTKDDIEWVIIEEPEMGLHPIAIQSLILTFLELISRGYKVVISTHSPVILEFCWAMKSFQESKADVNVLFDLFDVPKRPEIREVFTNALNSVFKTYFFERKDGRAVARDISELDPGSDDPAEFEWGGLASFSGRVTDLVSKLYAHDF